MSDNLETERAAVLATIAKAKADDDAVPRPCPDFQAYLEERRVWVSEARTVAAIRFYAEELAWIAAIDEEESDA